MVGELPARGQPQTVRVSNLFALADGTNEISEDHLYAAKAIWGRCPLWDNGFSWKEDVARHRPESPGYVLRGQPIRPERLAWVITSDAEPWLPLPKEQDRVFVAAVEQTDEVPGHRLHRDLERLTA